MDIEKTEFGYKVNEVVKGGYLHKNKDVRYEIISEWDNDLKLLSMMVAGNSLEKLANPDHFHHNRAKLAKRRQYKQLCAAQANCSSKLY